MLSGGPNYTSLLIGALLGFGLLYFFVALRKILARKPPAQRIESRPVLSESTRLNVRFIIGGTQMVLMLCIVFSFLPILFGFRGDGISWTGLALLVLFGLMLVTGIFFALRKRDLSWAGNWVDPRSASSSEKGDE